MATRKLMKSVPIGNDYTILSSRAETVTAGLIDLLLFVMLYRLGGEFFVEFLAHKGLDGLLQALVHGRAGRLGHALDMVQVGRVLDGHDLSAVLGGIEGEGILDAVGELELFPDQALVHGKGVHGAVLEAFLVRIEQGAGLVVDQDAAEIGPAELPADGPCLVIVDLAALGALFLAVRQDAAVLLERLPVIRGPGSRGSRRDALRSASTSWGGTMQER